MGPKDKLRGKEDRYKPQKLYSETREKLIREQLLGEQKLLMASQSSRKKPYTFGNLLPKISESTSPANKTRQLKTDAGENIRVTELLENIRKKGHKVRMEFITKRMGALRGEKPTDAFSLMNLIKNNIRENKTDTDSEQGEAERPSLVSNLSNLLDFPGMTPCRDKKQEESAKGSISKGLRLVNKLEDNEMLKLINIEEKVMNNILSKKNQDVKQAIVPLPPPTVVNEKEVTFMFLGDRHSAIRNFLLSKSWIEKYGDTVGHGKQCIYLRGIGTQMYHDHRDIGGGGKEETRSSLCLRKYLPPGTPEDQTYVRRLLQSPNRTQVEEPVKFIWLNSWLNWTAVSQRVVISRIPSNSPFNKTNLAIGLRNTLPFFFEKSEINARIPRTFEIHGEADMRNFQKHYRITACISMLKKFVATPVNTIANEGTVPLESVDFSVQRAIELLQLVHHEDLDEWNFSVVKESEWDTFLLRFYDMAHYDAKFQSSENFDAAKMNLTCKRILDMIFKVFPDMKYEGMKNLFICKPANGSCGRGVKVLRKLKDIEDNCKPELTYVIQKYIEMPLLVYNTKFDMRQWFVISSVSPLIIWMYDECYLRFCSQEFCLTNLHESVHLCNNTIQWKYKNGVRSSKLPQDNMWDNNEFAGFLKKEMKQDQWPHIQDQMRQALIAACIATQNRMYHRANSFQLFGADFMLTPDFKVWLIEINSQPAMKYSTSVTARMCKAVLEDTVKVGLLRKTDPSMKVGKFREIYHQTSEHPRTVLPSSGIVHSKKSTFLPNSQSNQIFESGKAASHAKRKLSYESFATYKTHPKVQIKKKVKSEKPLYPGDSTQSKVEENVFLSGAKEGTKLAEKSHEGSKRNENNRESTEKDGEKGFRQKKSQVRRNTDVQRSFNGIKTVTNNKVQNDKNEIKIKKANLKSNSIPKIIFETTKKAISNIKLLSEMIKGNNNVPPNKTKKILYKYLCENSSEMINLLREDESQTSIKVIDDCQNSGEEMEEVRMDGSQIVKRISEEELTECSSFDDVYTHDIITGKELLPELSGYAFIGESGEDRTLECLLNSSEFLSSIGKSNEKVRPIYQSFVNNDLQ